MTREDSTPKLADGPVSAQAGARLVSPRGRAARPPSARRRETWTTWQSLPRILRRTGSCHGPAGTRGPPASDIADGARVRNIQPVQGWPFGVSGADPRAAPGGRGDDGGDRCRKLNGGSRADRPRHLNVLEEGVHGLGRHRPSRESRPMCCRRETATPPSRAVRARGPTAIVGPAIRRELLERARRPAGGRRASSSTGSRSGRPPRRVWSPRRREVSSGATANNEWPGGLERRRVRP